MFSLVDHDFCKFGHGTDTSYEIPVFNKPNSGCLKTLVVFRCGMYSGILVLFFYFFLNACSHSVF